MAQENPSLVAKPVIPRDRASFEFQGNRQIVLMSSLGLQKCFREYWHGQS
jgi:hypothetical protein